MERNGRKAITPDRSERLFGNVEMSVECLVDGGHDRARGAELGEDLGNGSRAAGVKPLDLATESDVGDDRGGYRANPHHCRGQLTM